MLVLSGDEEDDLMTAVVDWDDAGREWELDECGDVWGLRVYVRGEQDDAASLRCVSHVTTVFPMG